MFRDSLLNIDMIRGEHCQQSERCRTYLYQRGFVDGLVEHSRRRARVDEQFREKLLAEDGLVVQKAIAIEQVDQCTQAFRVKMNGVVQNRFDA